MDGTALPPAIIYQAESGCLQNTWLDKFDPTKHNCYFTASKTGWTNEDLGFSWLTTLFDRATKEKANNGLKWRLLLVDGHNSHVNMKFLTWATANRILVAVFPPHSTHRLQPLDVCLYAPLSTYYSQQLDNWLFTTGGLSSMTKRSFFGLFWPAFQSAFTKENILSGWKQTGLQPWDPDLVVSQVKTEERPSSSSTGSSAISNPTWGEVRGLVLATVQGRVGKEVRKLTNTVDYLYSKNVQLEAKVANLQATMDIEKDKRRRKKPLLHQVGQEGEIKAMFWTPGKIGTVHRLQAEEAQAKTAAELQKEEERRQKQQAKEDKQLLMAQRKVSREKARLEREEEKQRKKRLREEAAEQRKADKQLTTEVQQAKKYLKNHRARSKLQQQEQNAAIEVDQEGGVPIRSSRSGRQLKPTRQFDS